MSVITTLYTTLESDERIGALLGQSTIDPTKKAIYDEWADNYTNFPYMVLSFSFTSGDHWGKNITTLNIDIFTEGDTVKAEDIKEACIFAIDRKTVQDPHDGAYIRCYYDTDAIISEPTPNITHWNMVFTLHHWRNEFIRHLES